MYKQLEKYRNPLFLLLLITYFGGAFQQPLYEALHILSHITDIVSSEYKYHSHSQQHRFDIDHDHSILTLIETDKNQDDDSEPINQNAKKKVEISSLSYNAIESNTDQVSNNFIYLMPISLFDKEKHLPPPKVS